MFALKLQVTWLEGHSLAQTVFTNLYLHNPYIIEDRCLKAYSLCTLKIVDHIRDRVNKAAVFEEVGVCFEVSNFKLNECCKLMFKNQPQSLFTVNKDWGWFLNISLQHSLTLILIYCC